MIADPGNYRGCEGPSQTAGIENVRPSRLVQIRRKLSLGDWTLTRADRLRLALTITGRGEIITSYTHPSQGPIGYPERWKLYEAATKNSTETELKLNLNCQLSFRVKLPPHVDSEAHHARVMTPLTVFASRRLLRLIACPWRCW